MNPIKFEYGLDEYIYIRVYKCNRDTNVEDIVNHDMIHNIRIYFAVQLFNSEFVYFMSR